MFSTIPVLSVVSQPFKRSQLGLFQGKTKQYGNNVPFSKHKTRRTWLPNVQRKRLHSETLGEDLRVKLTTRALRTIKKHAGLDNYLEKTSYKILGWEGMRLRLKIKEAKNSTTPLLPTTTIGASGDGEETSDVKATLSAGKDIRTEVGMKAPQEVQQYTKSPIPNELTARLAREQAMKALGLNSPPNARNTIAYLKQQKELLKATTATSPSSMSSR